MIMEWLRFMASAACLLLGLAFMMAAVFGVNRFHHALNRMHAAAMGDTLGLLFVVLSLMIMRGFSMDSLKLLLVILFFWMASPVSGHMISRLEAMTDQELGEITVMEADPEKETSETEENAETEAASETEAVSEPFFYGRRTEG